jgi:hypothetical protein
MIKTVPPFGQSTKEGSPSEELERSGEAILGLINRAAQVTAAQITRASETAREVSDHYKILRTASDSSRPTSNIIERALPRQSSGSCRAIGMEMRYVFFARGITCHGAARQGRF